MCCDPVPGSPRGLGGTGPAHLRTEGPEVADKQLATTNPSESDGEAQEGSQGSRAGPGGQDGSHVESMSSGKLPEPPWV